MHLPKLGLRTFGLFAALGAAAASSLINCAAPEAADVAPTEDAIGVDNKLGLGLRYDEATGTVQATLRQELAAGERIYVRVRREKAERLSQKDVDCAAIAQESNALTAGKRDAAGKVVFQGPAVEKSIIDLLHVYDDPRWATGDVEQALKDDLKANGAVPVVEACKMKGANFSAKLQVNLAYAWDQGNLDQQAGAQTKSIHLRSGDGGAPTGIDESNVRSQIEYGQLCESELGEIPFFPKIRDGEYETFDCREMLANGADGAKHAVTGVEGARIPAKIDGVEVDHCTPGRELGPESESYECLDKADHGMYLASGGTEPGPMVATAQNSRGTRWVLLCRKVADDGKGMFGTKKFNDVAMIGHNPKTGRTCFFQNSIGSGTDGEHVPHPGDVAKSTSMWSSYVQSYCSGSCHGNGPFVHSPWIDGAKRTNGKPIVPMLGTLPDMPISNPDAPYNIVAADKLGFQIPKVLVSDQASACINCHTLAQGSTMGNFTNWSTGTGDVYMNKITDYGKKFENSHWMPLNLDGMTADTWAASKYGKALEFIKKCDANANDPACEWTDTPRGAFNNPATR